MVTEASLISGSPFLTRGPHGVIVLSWQYNAGDLSSASQLHAFHHGWLLENAPRYADSSSLAVSARAFDV